MVWLNAVRDLRAKFAIGRRIERAALGNWGDTKSVGDGDGDGVSELRGDTGPGYRIYFTLRQGIVIVLLAGGDKASQALDVKRAKKLAKEL